MAILGKGTTCNAVFRATITALKKWNLEALVLIIIRMVWEAHFDP